MALTNVVSTEQETLCSHARVKYLLFISAKAKAGMGKRNATMEKVKLIAKGGGNVRRSKLGDLGAVYFNIQIKKSANQIYLREKVQQDGMFCISRPVYYKLRLKYI